MIRSNSEHSMKENLRKRMSACGIQSLAALIFALLLSTTLQAQTFSVLYNFSSLGNGANPTNPGIIAQGRDGYMYSTTLQGCGPYNLSGGVFKINPQGKFKMVVCLDSSNTLSGPYSGVTLGTNGKFYGTSNGGDYCGSVWETSSAGKLTNFPVFGGTSNLCTPLAPPVLGMDGDLYGTVNEGGSTGGCTYDFGGCGGIYKMTSAGKKYDPILSFVQADAANPVSPLLLGTDGNFYGTTVYGGSNGSKYDGNGEVYRITPAGDFTALYTFCSEANCADGDQPQSGLVEGTDGNFYGTTQYGGTGATYPAGVVFKVSPTGKYTVLHSFCQASSCADGGDPLGALVQATDGNFYGTTEIGGTHSDGVIFQITPSGNYTVLYNFDLTHGQYPKAAMIQHTNGILYGDTYSGGTSSDGVFFSLDMGLLPFAKLVTWWGKVGGTVEILGQGFSKTSSVSFNGTPATTFKATGDTYLTVTVPAGATSGLVTVVTATGTLTSNQDFQVQ